MDGPGSAARRKSATLEVDRLYGALRRGAGPAATLPEGHSAPTAHLVLRMLREAGQPVSAQEVAEVTGLGRSTAQRYGLPARRA